MLADSHLIYIADPDQAFAASLAALLESTGYRTKTFDSAPSLSAACKTQKARPAAAILNLDLCEWKGTPSADSEYFKFISEIPTIATSTADSFSNRLTAIHAGAVRYLAKPIVAGKLVGIIDDLTKRAPSAPYRILLIDDDERLLEYHAGILQGAGMETRQVSDPGLALEAIDCFNPDLILLDVYMPVCTGSELAAVLRADDRYAQIPIVFLSVAGSQDKQMEILKLAGDEFITKPIDAPHLISVAEARAKHFRHLQHISGELRASLQEIDHQQKALDQHAIVSITDVSGKIIYVNDKFCEISGYARDELLGQTHSIVNSGVHPTDFYLEMRQTIRCGQVWRGEICDRSKNGDIYWVSSTIVPFLDENRRPYRYVSILTDITQIKQIETQLRLSERNMAEAQHIAKVGSWEWDIAGDKLAWSDEIYDIFGLARLSFGADYATFMNAVHPDDRALVRTSEEHAFQGKGHDVEHRIVLPDGAIKWVHELAKVAFDPHGNPVHMAGTVQDITERKLLDLARDRLLAILESSPDFIATANPDGKLFFLNKAGRRMAGLAEDADISEIPIGYGHPEWARQIVLRKGLPIATQEGIWVGESAMLDGNGEEFPIRELIIAHKSPDGVGDYFSTVIQDLSQQKLAEAEIILTKEAAERANQAKSEFLSSMSHELRTPLNAILGFGQLLESDPDEPLSADQTASVAQITKAGWHLLDLINEILDLSRIEAGHINLSIEPVEVAEIIEECCRLAAPLAHTRDIDILRPLPAKTALSVKADRMRLKQVLLNLLSNAVKYNRAQGSITLSVAVATDDRVRVSVTDTGHGLTPDQGSSLFQPFNRLGAEGTEVEGTGIGLAISKRIVEMMGGSIGMESTPGVGSTFWFELNTCGPHERTDLTPEDKSAGNSRPEDHTRPYTLLYVEDNPANLKLVSQLLIRRQDIKLVTAHTGTLGLEFALAYRPDIILLDINLPGMDGYQLKAELALHDETRSTPVLALSANAMPRDIEKGAQAGFLHYLTKPIDIQKLMGAIDDVMSNFEPHDKI